MVEYKRKMTTKEKIALWSVVIVVFTFVFFIRRSEDISLDKCSKIVVAKPVEVRGSLKGGFTLFYQYRFHGVLYISSNGIGTIDFFRFRQSYFLKRRYYVKVQCENPRLTRVLWDKPVLAKTGEEAR